jgi:hypothetical protein
MKTPAIPIRNIVYMPTITSMATLRIYEVTSKIFDMWKEATVDYYKIQAQN